MSDDLREKVAEVLKDAAARWSVSEPLGRFEFLADAAIAAMQEEER